MLPAEIDTKTPTLSNACQMARMGRFLNFQKEPQAGDSPDVIVAIATSPYSKPQSFQERINTAIFYAQKYSTAHILFSGKRPHEPRATEAELHPDYAEAKLMRRQALQNCVPAARILRLEDESTNTKENVFYSMARLDPNNVKSVLFICGSLQARRVYYYFQNFLTHHPEYAKLKMFVVDATLQNTADHSQLDPEQILYESQKLFRYRRAGDL